MKGNPKSVKLSPTPAKVQAHMAEEREKMALEEHRRQAQIKLKLWRELAQMIEQERELGVSRQQKRPKRNMPEREIPKSTGQSHACVLGCSDCTCCKERQQATYNSLLQ